MIYFSVSKHIGFIIQRGVITAKIRFGILFCFLPMQFLMFSLAFLMLRIVFNVFLVMFAKMSLLFCCLCIRLSQFQICLCLLAYGVMRNFDAIIRVSKYVRLNPGLQRARPLWCGGASKEEICIFFPRKENLCYSQWQRLEQLDSPNLDSDGQKSVFYRVGNSV